MSSTELQTQEAKLRRQLRKAGYLLKKSRVVNTHLNDRGGYMIVDMYKNLIVYGERFDLEIEDVEQIIERLQTKNNSYPNFPRI